MLSVIEELTKKTALGIALGKKYYKIRVAITSKRKGKAGGARVITYVHILKETVFLLTIYDKSDQATISDKELKLFID